MHREDVEPFWVGISTTAAQSDSGTPVQRVVLIDITDSKTMAEAIHESESRYRTLADQHIKASSEKTAF